MNNISNFKFKTGLLSAALVGFLFIIPACKKSNDGPDKGNTSDNVKVNEWVVDNMRDYYYWNDGIPADSRLDFNLEPPAFFETILNREDRFSWIDKADDLKEGLEGVSTTTGLNFGLVGNQDGSVFAYIRYVIPSSPADLQGIKRGMLFTKINGVGMTVSNYNQLLDPYYKGVGFSVQLAEFDGNSIKQTKEVTIGAAKVSEPSVHYKEVLTTKSGRKVGYLFYNRFLNDKSQELFDAFQYFKNNGVEDLILDVRYNLGGGIAVSGLLSALIKQNYDENDVFVEYKYNKLLNDYYDAQFLKDPLKNESRIKSFKNLFASDWLPKVKPANLNLGRVYILATYNSASASELVINNLRPFLGNDGVVHIGDTTRGKNEGSFTIEDDRKPRQIDWAIQPIVLKLANKDHFGDYANGLFPSKNNIIDEGFRLKPLGDISDPLLAQALSLIDPSMPAPSAILPERMQKMFKGIKSFDEKQYKARPVQVDGTIDKKKFLKAR